MKWTGTNLHEYVQRVRPRTGRARLDREPRPGRRGMRTPVDTPGGEIVVYEAPDGEVRVDVRLERETVWLSQKQMAELFDTSTDNVGLHLKNVYAEGELSEGATAEETSVVQTE